MARTKKTKAAKKKAKPQKLNHLMRKAIIASSAVMSKHIDEPTQNIGGIINVSVSLQTDATNGRKVLVLDKKKRTIKDSAMIFVAGGSSIDTKVAKANKIMRTKGKF